MRECQISLAKVSIVMHIQLMNSRKIPFLSLIFIVPAHWILFIPGTEKCRNVMSISPAPAPGRVTFMPGSVAGEIPADPRKTASDLPGPGSGVAKRPGSRLNRGRGRDPGRALLLLIFPKLCINFVLYRNR